MTSFAMAPSHEALAGLLRKYRTLLELRRMKREDGVVPPMTTFRSLAREFPGALRELDTLAVDAIEQRIADLVAATSGRDAEPWVAWMLAYHALMRAALHLKPALSGLERRGAPVDFAHVAAEAARETQLPLDEAFVRGVARPRDGRLNAHVFDTMQALFAVPATMLWDTLFPTRRARRY